MLNDQLLERYSRQILLPEIDLAGQENIRQAAALIVGCGGLSFISSLGFSFLLLISTSKVDSQLF